MDDDEDRMLRDVQDALLARMRTRGVDVTELARLMDLDRAIVAQMFTREAPALTVRRLARAAHVLGLTLSVRVVDRSEPTRESGK